MVTTTKMVCLAKSRRWGGLCIAGRRLDKNQVGEWLRPVDLANDEAISRQVARYRNGREIELSDIIELNLVKSVPNNHQHENWTFNGALGYRGRYRHPNLSSICDGGDSLWRNGYSSSIGFNNRVPNDQAKLYKDSLRLIRVDRLTLRVFKDDFQDRTRVNGIFSYRKVMYTMQVTDVAIEDRYNAMNPGDYELHDQYLTVSLAGEYEGFCYKLIVGVM